jgi:tRNA(Ile)-lysidine synthase
MDSIPLSQGTYVVAVSGGVDSVVLLDILAKPASSFQLPTSKLVVAHLDHGIRESSSKDREFVQDLAVKYGLQFVYNIANLGAGASEATARKARYEFLHAVRRACDAKAIITAHHQDDRIETAFINLIRGTGRKGLTSLTTKNSIIRPLLHYSKCDVVTYAKERGLQWREDATNKDAKYLRNKIRHSIVPKLTTQQRADLVSLLNDLQAKNDIIDAMLINKVHTHSPRINHLNKDIIMHSDFNESCEIIATWLRCNNVLSFDKKLIHNLVVNIKTLASGSLDVGNGTTITIKKQTLALKYLDR